MDFLFIGLSLRAIYPSGPGEHPYYPGWSQEGEERSKLKKEVEGSYSDTNNNPPCV